MCVCVFHNAPSSYLSLVLFFVNAENVSLSLMSVFHTCVCFQFSDICNVCVGIQCVCYIRTEKFH